MSRRRLLAGASAGAALAGLSAEAQQRVKSGTVDIEQVQVAFIGSGACTPTATDSATGLLSWCDFTFKTR